MPAIYSNQHDKFIDNYLTTFEPRIINKERITLGRFKNGYIFPFILFLRYIPSYLHGA